MSSSEIRFHLQEAKQIQFQELSKRKLKIALVLRKKTKLTTATSKLETVSQMPVPTKGLTLSLHMVVVKRHFPRTQTTVCTVWKEKT